MNLGQTNSFDQNQLKKYPKVELHRHLEGSLRLSTLKELAPQVGIEVPQNSLVCSESFLVTKPMEDLAAVLQKFLKTQAVLASEEILSRITYEAIEDAASEGIRILELRYAPSYILEGHSNLTYEKITRAIQKGAQLASDLPISVGFIGIIQRTRSIKEAEKIMDFIIENKEHFLGVDLADNEEGFASQPFSKIFEKAQATGLGVTIHAGEVPTNSACQNVMDAINLLGATRIGHGVQIYRDLNVIDLVRKKSVTLELCPTSNWLTQAISSLGAHPIRQLMNAGVLVTINSDDPGIFGINLTHEYNLLFRQYQFTQVDFDHCNDVAAQASFIPLLKKQKNWPRPIHGIG